MFGVSNAFPAYLSTPRTFKECYLTRFGYVLDFGPALIRSVSFGNGENNTLEVEVGSAQPGLNTEKRQIRIIL